MERGFGSIEVKSLRIPGPSKILVVFQGCSERQDFPESLPLQE